MTIVALVDTPHAHGLMPALRHFDEYLVPAAALAHLAVEARGSWRVRRGWRTWEQAGPDGQWTPVDILMIGEVVWFRLAPGWRLRGPADRVPRQQQPNSGEMSGDQLASPIPMQGNTSRSSLAIVPPVRRPA